MRRRNVAIVSALLYCHHCPAFATSTQVHLHQRAVVRRGNRPGRRRVAERWRRLHLLRPSVMVAGPARCSGGIRQLTRWARVGIGDRVLLHAHVGRRHASRRSGVGGSRCSGGYRRHAALASDHRSRSGAGEAHVRRSAIRISYRGRRSDPTRRSSVQRSISVRCRRSEIGEPGCRTLSGQTVGLVADVTCRRSSSRLRGGVEERLVLVWITVAIGASSCGRCRSRSTISGRAVLLRLAGLLFLVV